jgi:hypothetical protein
LSFISKFENKKFRDNECYGDFAEFTAAIRSFFFEEIPKLGKILKERIHDNF